MPIYAISPQKVLLLTVYILGLLDQMSPKFVQDAEKFYSS